MLSSFTEMATSALIGPIQSSALDLTYGGVFVAITLIALFLTRELLPYTKGNTPRARMMVNLAIFPLLVLFIVEIASIVI